MTLYDHAKAACAAGQTIAECMPLAGATLADDTWPVVKAVKAARFEFPLTRNWPVSVWVRNGPGENDRLEAIADVGGVAFELVELPETKHMTDAEIERTVRAAVREQIRAGIKNARNARV